MVIKRDEETANNKNEKNWPTDPTDTKHKILWITLLQ